MNLAMMSYGCQQLFADFRRKVRTGYRVSVNRFVRQILVFPTMLINSEDGLRIAERAR
jgi:hypothetical protein